MCNNTQVCKNISFVHKLKEASILCGVECDTSAQVVVEPSRKAAFCFERSLRRPSMKRHCVGWLLWRSDCRLLCQSSHMLFVLATPSSAASVWFHVSIGNIGGLYSCPQPLKTMTVDICMFEVRYMFVNSRHGGFHDNKQFECLWDIIDRNMWLGS